MKVLTQKKISYEWIILAILITIFIAIGLLSLTSKTSAPDSDTPIQPSAGYRQEREEADVTVSVEYLPQQANSDETNVEVTLDTHSVNLDNVNFSQDVTVEKDGKVIKPIRINEEGSGHHRKTQLTFPKTPLPFIIIVSNVSGISRREFTFE